jgi:hypothetical protein
VSLHLERLLTPLETASVLRVSVGTLAVWRATKRYPLVYIKCGRSVRYRESDLKAFIESRIS